MKQIRKILITLAVLISTGLLLSPPAIAAGKNGKTEVNWVRRDGIYYAYSAQTGRLLRNRRVGRYFTNKDGSRVTNAFRKGDYYNWKGKRTGFRGGFIKVKGQLFYFRNQKKLTGFRKIGKYYYCFGSSGAAMTGLIKVKGKWRYFRSDCRLYRASRWKTIGGKRYFLSSKGIMKEGFFRRKGKTYYQTAAAGIVKGLCVIGGQKYFFDDSGALNDTITARARRKDFPESPGRYSDLTFFTRYESGSLTYGQTGGDKGRAYGKYQFDYRYSLVGLLSYCLKQNPTTCAEFAPFVRPKQDRRVLIDKRYLDRYIDKDKDSEETIKALKASPDLASAWTCVYNRDPSSFASWQDQYALLQYYMPVERALAARGIHLSTRTYVERGAVFSYSIQEGQSAAAEGVAGAGITDGTSSRDFLNRLYDYRWKDPHGWDKKSIFYYRYTHEKAEALDILTSLGG